MKHIGLGLLLFFSFFAMHEVADAAEAAVPEPFQRFDDSSGHTINYDDLTTLLKLVVVDTGRSSRRVVQPSADVTGTRMKTKVKMTANEANRFYFETFRKDKDSQQFLRDIQKSLEQLPSEAPLEYFSRAEQLAYWLNLYNVTVLNEVISVYPKKNLKGLFRGKKSIFSKKLLTVAGVPLSLDDIQFNILKNNYDNDPLIMYGLYQGIIGGPNIRKSAYTGAKVYDALKDNAREFINSNRGTYSRSSGELRVSSFYDRNRSYFPSFDSDLRQHLATYLKGDLIATLQSASKIKPNIDDWSITDLGGSQSRIGGSFATSRAALLDSVKSTVPADGGGVTGAAVGAGSSAMVAKGRRLSRIQPELLEILQEIDDKRRAENLRNATVTVEEIGEAPVAPASDPVPDEKEQQ